MEGLAGPLATGLLELAGGDADVVHVAPEHEVHLQVGKVSGADIANKNDCGPEKADSLIIDQKIKGKIDQ